jgi:hypothetical protein
MGKSVLLLSMLSVIILFLGGLLAPNSPIMWMASTDDAFLILRGVLIVILLGLLVTNPPRNVYFRAFVAAVSVGVTGWVLSETYQNQMHLLDTMVLLQVCISATLTVLERNLETNYVINPRKIPVRYEKRISITT